jgi:dihydroxy-acid dehydratase
MACVGEAIGLSLPHSNMMPAPYGSRADIAIAAGKQVMTLIERNIRPRDICTRQAFENAARIVAATGGSTNAALHLPAMANETGIDFDLFDVAEIFKTTPYIADLKPGGKYVAKDMYDAGGVYMLMKTLFDAGFLHGECMTVTGKTLAENIDEVTWNPDQKVIYPVSNPLSPTGGVVGLKGSLAPDGAIVKVAGMARLQFSGPAQVFDCEEDCFAAVEARQIEKGAVVVIRLRDPRYHGDADDHGSKGTFGYYSYCTTDDLFGAPARLYGYHRRIHSGVQCWPRHWPARACPIRPVHYRHIGCDVGGFGHSTLCHAKPDEQFPD